MRLLEPMERADYMIVADTLCNNKVPGSLSRLTRHELRDRVAAKNSLHQVSFLETIAYANFLGILPETVLIGCEPEDMGAWGMELTPRVASARGKMTEMVVTEIAAAGGKCTVKRILQKADSTC